MGTSYAIIIVVLFIVLIVLALSFKSFKRLKFGNGESYIKSSSPDSSELPSDYKLPIGELFVTSNKQLTLNIKYNNSKGCKIYVGKGAKGNANIVFKGDNSKVYIGSRCVLKDVDIRVKQSGNIVAIGNGTQIYGRTKLVSGNGLYEDNTIRPYILIGDGCLIAEDVIFRNTDSHPIYDDEEVLNNPITGIRIHNHVWIGERASILKNVSVGDGSIIALGAVVSKSVPADHIARGNPVIISKNVTSDGKPRHWRVNTRQPKYVIGGTDTGVYTTFPYLYLTLPSTDKMFKAIKDNKYKLIMASNNHHKNKKNKRPQSQSPILIRSFPGDYQAMDALSNHFIEDVRIDCRAGGKPTPREVWERMKDTVAPPDGDITRIAELREEIYGATRECNTFNPVFVKAILETLFGDKVKDVIMLDPSSGWGDRLIGAAATGIKKYIGFDPNPRIKDCYAKMIKQFTTPEQDFSVRTEPFKFVTSSEGNGNKPSDTQVAGPHIALTSPPYFDYEEYVLPGNEGEKEQSIGMYPKYEDWKKKMYIPYITDMYNSVRVGGWVVVYIEDYYMNNTLYPLRQVTTKILESLGAKRGKYSKFGLQIRMSNSKSKAKTRWAMCYQKV